MSDLHLKRLRQLRRRHFTDSREADWRTSESWQQCRDAIFQALLPFGEARIAVARKLYELELSQQQAHNEQRP